MKKQTNAQKRNWRISRRGFLIGLGATGATLALGLRFGLPQARLTIAGQFADLSLPGGLTAPPTAWFEVTADNRIRLFVPKVEMGQGIHTALAQIAAEELAIDWEQLEVVQAGSGQGLDEAGLTGASESVSKLYQPLREAAATLREMLRHEAARQLGVPVAELVGAAGAFFVETNPARRLTYGQVTQHAEALEVPDEVPPLKPVEQFRYIGQSLARLDLPAKVLGAAIYGYDLRRPNMLYGAVARPRTLLGKLRRAGPGQAAGLPGVVKVVIEENFAGVVAETRTQAYAALAALDLEWEEADHLQQAEVEAIVTVGQGGTETVVQREGAARLTLATGNIIEAEYRTPLAVHAPMEPPAALVDVQPDKVQVWASTQYPVGVRDLVAEVLDRQPERIEVMPTYLGGGFGRKLGIAAEVATEAARLSAAVGRPVHVGWNRTEDLQHGYFRPPTHHLLRAKLDSTGLLEAIEHRQASGDVVFFFLPKLAPLIFGADFGAWRGGLIPYDVPHKDTIAWRTRLPFTTGWWRGLGLLANVFATESFMDEVAHAAGADPLEFRLRHLGTDERSRRVRRALETVGERSGWGTPPPPGRARGLAFCTDIKTVVAQVAEVSVDERSGQIRVHKFTSVVDPGLVINPDGAVAQIQGNIIMGLSSTLFEEITLKDGRVEVNNFDGYPLLTMKETPEIEVVLLESGDEPYGLGEPPIGPVPAAVANAIFALTGQRLRRLPLRLA